MTSCRQVAPPQVRHHEGRDGAEEERHPPRRQAARATLRMSVNRWSFFAGLSTKIDLIDQSWSTLDLEFVNIIGTKIFRVSIRFNHGTVLTVGYPENNRFLKSAN